MSCGYLKFFTIFAIVARPRESSTGSCDQTVAFSSGGPLRTDSTGFFPATHRICEDLATTKQATAIFQAAGFALEADRRIQQTCASLREFAERTRQRADTALALISDEEFAQGLAALEEAAAQEPEPSPVLETLDLLVFRAVS